MTTAVRPVEPSPVRSDRDDLLRLGALAVLYFAAHRLGAQFVDPTSQVAAVWPASGVALAIAALAPARLRVQLLALLGVVGLVSNLLNGFSLLASTAFAVAMLAEVLVAGAVLVGSAPLPSGFEVRLVVRLLTAALAGAGAGAAIGALAVGIDLPTPYGLAFRTWWTANALGMLLVTPLILTWRKWPTTPAGRRAELALLCVLGLAGGAWAFAGRALGTIAPHPYMLLPVASWAAMRFGPPVATALLAAIAAIAVGTTIGGVGTVFGAQPIGEQLLLVQVYLGITAAATLLLAASASDARRAASQAETSRAWLQAIGDNLPDGMLYRMIALPDGRRRFLHVSGNVVRLTGRSVREVLADAHALYGAIHPDDLPILADAEAVTIRDQSIFRAAVRLQRADGEWRRVELASAPRPQDDGTVVWDGLMLDVTERQREQQQLRRVLRTLRTLSNAGRVLIRATDEDELLQQVCDVVRDDGGYPLVTVGYIVHDEAKSVAMMAMAGTPASLAHARNLRISWGPMPSGMGPTGRAVHDGTIQRSGNFLTDPVMAPWREAVIRADLSSLIVLPLKVDGVVIGTLNVYSSIADADMGVFDAEETALLAELADNLAFGIRLLRAQQARAAADAARFESETRFRQLAETINEVFWLQDAATKRMLYVSPAFEQLWGHPAALLDDGDPMAWLRTVHPDDRARVAEADARDRLEGRYDIEYRIVRLDGATRWIHDRAVPIRDEAGTVVRIAGVAEDVTARRAAEDQLRQAQKMEAIGQLAGGVAHDFNNILAAIRLQTELAMQEPGVTPTVGEALATVRDSARRAADLTRQLLLFGRRSVMQPVPVDLTEVLTGVTRMLQRTLREDIALQVQVGGGPLPLVADPTMLDQVIVNLVVNARDAMPNGGRLVLAAERRTLAAGEPGLLLDAPPGEYACLRVSDEGSGIAPEHLERIFEPFFTTKPAGIGTGLGLATVFGVVRQHGGTLRVQSRLGAGTTFEVYLPLRATGPAAASATTTATSPLPGGSETILVVEDDASVRRATRLALTRHGYQVLEATDAEEAVRRWTEARDRIALLLTDIVMPGGRSGHALAEELRRERPSLRVVLTSGYDAETAGRLLQLGPHEHFLAKPAALDELLGTVRRALDA